MNGQFQVAQASGTTGNSGNSTPPRIFKLTKPLSDQAVVVNLGYDQKVQVDFSSIANEKITLVHVGEKLIILFDNQSTVTVEPFFDSRHDALNNLTIEVAPGRDLSVAEFASSFPISTDQSVLPAAGTDGGNAQATGAHFDPSAVDALPPIPTNTLAPPETLPNLTFANPTSPILTTPATPAVVAPSITVNGTLALTLSETHLTSATDGINGTAPNLALTSTTGKFGSYFTDTAGSAPITSVAYALSINGGNGTASGLIDSQTQLKDVLVLNTATGAIEGHVGASGGALAFTISVDPATGVVTFTEDRAVDQTQVSNTSLSENIASLTAGVLTLSQTVTDANNNTASANLDLGPHFSITDDGPVANPDTAKGVDGATLTVAAGAGLFSASSTGGADKTGADGANVTGVEAGTVAGPVSGHVGSTVTGADGTLTLNVDGSFSYVANNNVAVGSQDKFTYTITDNDGTTSTSTLTITITAGAPPVGGASSSESVNESALAPNGSGVHLTPDAASTTVAFTAGADDLHVTLNASALTTTLAGFPGLSWTVVPGGQEIDGFQNSVEVVKFDITAGSTIAAGTTGNVTVVETLLAQIDGEGTATGNLGTVTVTGTDTVNPATVTDTVTATVVDDGPKANPDTGSTTEGSALTVATVSGVLSNDVSGADVTSTSPLVVLGVEKGGSTSDVVTAGVGAPVAGLYGTLTLHADGSYTYVANNNVANGSKDVFTYTAVDNDGTTSSAQLTITVNEGAAPTGGTTAADSVLESGLTSASSVSDHHSVSFTAGSDTITASSEQLSLTGSSLTTTLPLGPQGQSFAPLTWTQASTTEIDGYQVINGVKTEVVTLTLTGAADIVPHGTGSVTVTETLVHQIDGEAGIAAPDLGTVQVVATDTNNRTVTDTVTVNVVDDAPKANPDTGSTTEGATLAVDAAHGLFSASNTGGADTTGADTPTYVTSVSSGATTQTLTGSGGAAATTITGVDGTLTLNADGSFTYVANNNVANGSVDTFHYTITDADGTTSTSTLAITVNEGAAPTGGTTAADSVLESGLTSASSVSDHHSVSFTAGSDTITASSEQLSLTGSSLTTTLPLGPQGQSFAPLTWTQASTTEIDGYQVINGVKTEVVTLTLTGAADIVPHGTGSVTVTETLVHQIDGEAGIAAPDLGTVQVVATDTNNRTVTDTVTVNVVDDGPTNIIPGLAVLTDPSTSCTTPLSSITVPLDFDGNVHNNYGADQVGATIQFASAAVASLSALGLTSDGAPISYLISNSGELLTATIDGGTETVFTITLNPNAPDLTSTGDTYTVNMYAPVDSTTPVSFSNSSIYNFVGGNTSWVGYESTNPAITADLLVTPIDNGPSWQSGGTITSNANEFGISGGNSVGPGQGLRLDFVNSITGTPDSGKDYSTHRTENYTDHYTVNGATEAIFVNGGGSNTSGAEFIALADLATSGHPTIAEGAEINITSIAIAYGGQTLLIPEVQSGAGTNFDQPQNYTVGTGATTHTFTVEFLTDPTSLAGGHPATVVEVTSIVDSANIGIFTTNGYQSLETVYLSGTDFKIGGLGASVPSTAPVDFSAPLTITDGDGSTASGALSVSLLPSSATQDHSSTSTGGHTYTSTAALPNIIDGSGNNDILNGLNGTNDILYGGSGSGDVLNAGTTGVDILIGGPGTNPTLNGTINPTATAYDEFVLQVSNEQHDTINNFNPTYDGILVDIGAGGTLANAMASSGIASTNLVAGAGETFNGTNHFAFNTTNHELYFSADATAAHAIDIAHIATGVPTAASIHIL